MEATPDRKGRGPRGAGRTRPADRARDTGSAEPVHSITSAATGRSADFDARVNRYLISMGVRTACFILAFVVDGPLRWVFVTGALLLPYVAVVLANTPSTRRGSPEAPGPKAPEQLGDRGMGTLPRPRRDGAGRS